MKLLASELISSPEVCCDSEHSRRLTIPLTAEAVKEFSVGQSVVVKITGEVIEVSNSYGAEMRVEIAELEVSAGKSDIEKLVVEEDDE